MKIALCISGQPRNVQKGYSQFIQPNFLAHNECDVFIHTWWNSNQVGKKFINAGNHVASDPVGEDDLALIIKLYNPVTMHFEPQIDFDTSDYVDNIYPGVKPFSSLSQKYSSMRVHELRRESGREYDAVVRLRFDFALKDKITVAEADLDKLSIPNRCNFPGGVDDTFAIGSPAIMDVYSDLYNCIHGLYQRGIPFCDELLLGQHLVNHGISVDKHNIQYDLIRG